MRAARATSRNSSRPVTRACSVLVVGGVMNAVVHGNFVEIEGTDAVQASDIDAVLPGVRPPLMVGVDAALGAETVFRRHRVELVGGEGILSREYGDAIEI